MRMARKGYTLVEVIVGLLVFTVGALAVAAGSAVIARNLRLNAARDKAMLRAESQREMMQARSRQPFSGFSLLELVVVLALVGLSGTIIGTTLVRQQRFYRGAADVLKAREGVRDAMEVLSADVRTASIVDTVRVMTDSAFEFFTTIGSSVICAGSTSSDLVLAVQRGPRGNTLTSFANAPDTGDLAVIYGDSAGASEQWRRTSISSFGSRAGVESCLGSSDPADRAGYLLRITNGRVAPSPGKPVRFLRRARYSLYRSSDGKWYLGYRRCNALGPPQCGAVQPLSGPYRPYSARSTSTGLLFEYFDVAGAQLTGASGSGSLARVDITARSESGQRISGGPVSEFGDSGTVSIAIRND
ncbi:MAG TPA: prepilin-type N-terminal cleavage/methylation domain-containing protein [Gemmatimonadaceae bacterium]|jgi:prepilin-type N-terminal cleavage/methylation domain-containing protein